MVVHWARRLCILVEIPGTARGLCGFVFAASLLLLLGHDWLFVGTSWWECVRMQRM